ncbi:MAG: hypothetical protein D4R68_05600 [Ignavibacteriales bacterium]|nr:MAG: hypothetical protein D4R68_05600 [Ignavibacteriales bacterium]
MILGVSYTAISAQTVTPRINKTQKKQQLRVHQGIKSGELTRGEVRKLENQQKAIQRDKRIAKADEVVTPGERKQIRKEQNRASNNIYIKKHNRIKQ